MAQMQNRQLSQVLPKQVYGAMPPNAQKSAQSAYQKGGAGHLAQNVAGQPWENEVKQALAAGTGAAQNKPGQRPATKPQAQVAAPQQNFATATPQPSMATATPQPSMTNTATQPGPAPQGGGGGPAGPPPSGPPAATGWQGVGNILNRLPEAVREQLMAGMKQIPAGGGSRYNWMVEQLKAMNAPGVSYLPVQGKDAFDWYAWNSSLNQQAPPPGVPGPQVGGGGQTASDPMPPAPPPPGTDPMQMTKAGQIPQAGGVPPVGGTGTVDPALLQQIIGTNPGGFITPF